MGFRPAFSTSLSLSRDQASANSVFHGQCTCVLQRTARPAVIRAPKRAAVRMLGPFFPNLGDSKLLKSEIVRQEMLKLENDYAELAQLGQRYTSFDREGKIMFVDRAMDVVDRFAIFLTRLKLSEDFSSQLFVKQYQLKLQEFGLTIDSLVANTKSSLEMMRSEIPDL